MARRILLVLAAALALAAVAGTSTASTERGHPDRDRGERTRPTRVLIVVFDQMRPEYADRFNMVNFKALRDGGTNFKKAFLGRMGSETVISHNVMVSGQSPRNMGWVDEAYRDEQNLLGGGAGKMRVTGDLTLAQFEIIGNAEGYPKLSDYLHTRSPGSKFIAVGEKSYAVESVIAGTGDIGVRMSSRRAAAQSRRRPAGADGRQAAGAQPTR